MRGLLVASVLVAALIAGCQVYDPSLVHRSNAQGRQPPPRPSGTDSDGPEVAFGLRMVVMEQGDDWGLYGYNLDGFVTSGESRTAECIPPARPAPVLDGPNGVDNVFGSDFFPLVALTTPDLERTSREAQEAGQGLPIVRIRGWNGMADDPRVDAHVMQAVFGAPGGEEMTPPPPPSDPSTSRPIWNGRDWFWVREDSFLMGDVTRPLIRDDNAYVADNVLVARLPSRVDIVFPAEDYGVLVRLTDAVVTGTINADRSGIENVIVSGRWAINDLLSTARNVGVCPGARDYELLVGQLDTIADVRSDPGTGGTDVRCDAISIGVGFTATRVRVAGLAMGRELADRCATLADGGIPDGGSPADAGMLSDGGSLEAGALFDGGPPDAGRSDGGRLDARAGGGG